MAYRIPNLTESEELLVAGHRRIFPGSDAGARRSYHRRRAQWIALALTELHAHLEALGDDVMPDTATGAMAERWGGIVGTRKKPATPARKSDALRVVGDAGTPINSGTELVHPPSGLRFKINEDDVVPAGGEVDVDIVAIDTGSRTRLTKGEVLEFVATPIGLEPRAELQKDLDEDGFDVEQEPAFKRRYLKAFGEPSAGGNDADWERWMTAIAGIEQAFAYPNRAGRGTLDIVALHAGSGAERALTNAEAAAVVAALAKLGPSQLVAIGGSLRHLTVVPDEQDIELTIEPSGSKQFAFDWDDSTPPMITAWDPPTNTATLNARPASMKAGDRICIHGVATAQDGAPLVIESLVGANQIKLEKAPRVAPANTDLVYAGGPLTALIRDAILAHVGGDLVFLGDNGPLPAAVAEEQNTSIFDLRILAEGIGPANPGGKYGDWSGGLVHSTLEKIATSSRGVRKATCLVPVSDYEAEDYGHGTSTAPFTEDYKIGLIVAGEVLVRRAW